MSSFSQTNLAAAAALGLACFALGYASNNTYKARNKRAAIESPLQTLIPRMSDSQVARLPYPPDFFPGARDVATPYGKMRVYEWGPADGKKIAMVPGDTTPAPIFCIIAKGLVDRGSRVLVLDTWGRGYSDTPMCAPHNVRLFAMQIVFAILSSPLSWTGTETFSIIGFSLGGAIAMSFASHFPNLIDSIILLAPVGLLRSLPGDYSSFSLHHHEWTPFSYLRRVVASVVGVNPQKQASSTAGSSKRASSDNPDLPALWQWQFDAHEGFVYSFADTIQNGPQLNQQSEWRKLCKIISGSDTDPSTLHCKLRNSRVLLICGESDTVIKADETMAEMSKLLPDENLVFRTVPGDHGFPIPSGEATLQHIFDFWDPSK